MFSMSYPNSLFVFFLLIAPLSENARGARASPRKSNQSDIYYCLSEYAEHAIMNAE